MRKTLSVIIPNFNHAHFLPGCVESIFAQSRLPDEVLITDDCSTDNSFEVLSELAKKYPIKISRNKANSGTNITNNEAARRATGDYLFFMAADDYMLPGMIEKTMAQLEKHPEAGLCSSHPTFFDSKSNTLQKKEGWFLYGKEPQHFTPTDAVGILGPADRGIWLAGHTCILKREAFFEMGEFVLELLWHVDWFLYHCIAFKYGFCHIPENLAVMRILENSYSAQGGGRRQAEVLWRITELLKTPKYSSLRDSFYRSKAFDFYDEFADDIMATEQPWRTWGNAKRELVLNLMGEFQKLQAQVKAQSDIIADSVQALESHGQLLVKHSEAINSFNRIKDIARPIKALFAPVLGRKSIE